MPGSVNEDGGEARTAFAEMIREALALHRSGRVAEAYARYRELLTQSPGHPDLLNLAGVAAWQRGEGSAAEAYFSEAVTRRPDFAEARVHLASVLKAKGDVAAAREHLEAALKEKPDHVPAWRNLGKLLQQQKDHDAAANAYRRALQIRPGDADTLCYLADALSRGGHALDAARTYEQALAVEPAHPRALGHLGITLQNLGRLEEALALTARAAELTPEDPMAQYNHGCLLQALGQLDQAAFAYERALNLDGSYAKALYNLGMVRQGLGDNDGAATAYEELLQRDPDHASAKHMLDAARGHTTAIAPAAHIREIFDSYAAGFEAHLVQSLRYRAPEALRNAIDRSMQTRNAAGGEKPFRLALDLGCGTGLVARQVADLTVSIHGLDIAPKMAAAARDSGLYEAVFEEDVVAFLTEGSGRDQCYDLVLSADVFIYIGDLDPVFGAVAAHMPPGGIFVFSIEALEQGDYALRPTGRYAQSRLYVERLAAAHGFAVANQADFTLREEWNRPIAGLAFLLERRRAD